MPQFVPIEELFKGRHFDREIVILCVRWYLSFKLSYRDLVTMMGERGPPPGSSFNEGFEASSRANEKSTA